MNFLNIWIASFRLRTLPLALSSIFLGSILATAQGEFSSHVLIWASITTILLQVLSNLSNDYGDSVSGIDNQNRVGPTRMVQGGFIPARKMKVAMIICGFLAFVSGIILLWTAPVDRMLSITFFIVGLVAIAAAVKYTVGKNPFGYKGMGDIAVFLFFGIIGVVGTWMLHGNSLTLLLLLPAFTIGFFSSGVMNLNNIRDIDSDSVAGKRTIATMLGRRGATLYHLGLITAGWASFLIYLLLVNGWLVYWPSLITVPFFVRHLLVTFRYENPRQLDNELRNLALTTFGFVILCGLLIFI